MSGHSKWATIHRQKSASDAKRGAVFTKLARNITLAAKEKSGNSETNSALRAAIEKAKQFNMPKDNIERAIKRGTGELEGMNIEEIIYEAFGPEGIALIIKAITDNRNRTVANIRHILTRNGGSFGASNTVLWMFEQKAVIRIKASDLENEEDLELALIEAGAEDIKKEDGDMVIYANIKDFQTVKEVLEKKGIHIESAELEWIAKNEVAVNESAKEKIEKLFEALDEDEDVQEVYTNARL